MKKSLSIVLCLALVTPSVCGQKIPIRWVKMSYTVPDSFIGAGIKHPIWYPQIDSCAGAAKINRYLKKHAPEWSDSNYKGLDTELGGTVEEKNVVSVTYNDRGLLSLNKYWGYSRSNGRANDGYHFGLTFDTNTGAILTTDDFIDQSALSLSTALQSDEHCFLTKNGLTIPDQGGNQEFTFRDLKKFARKRYRYLFR